VEPGPEENLVCVDVPDTRNDLLMHQERLQPTAPLPQNSHKVLLRDKQGINPKSAREVSFKPGLVQQ
jgi:hypothetical protein